ncbi:MAG: (2Fe-2S) ferredoxin domain-containing protein [Candidatus Coatesbacteria bacterium]|nr:MAG: (2Fe-2S) ferredoxin domain-containing protein [Candidatus Coatesbacteria bacterium]
MKLEDLRKMVEGERPEEPAEGAARCTVVVGMGTCGIAAGAREVLAAIIDELEARGITDVIVTQCGCRGVCEREPLVMVTPRDGAEVVYADMTPERVREVVATHVVGGEAVEAYRLAEGS